jgi:hypothetical protein
MRYWNKNPRSRQYWTKIIMDIRGSDIELMRYFEIDRATDQRKIWCQNNGSTRRFYFSFRGDSGYLTNWWFENPHDATLFVLRWL